MKLTRPYKLALGVALVAIWMVLAAEAPVRGQPSHFQVAVLTPGLTLAPVHEGLKEGLARLGYMDAKNITYVMADTKGNTSDLVPKAAKLLAAKPDLIFAVTTNHTAAAKQATATVPIVFAWVGDPVQLGLVASYAS